MNIELSRRQFVIGASAGLAGTTLGALGFGEIEAAYADSIRPFKLANTTETRNTCTYCSVACGIIMYSQGRSSEGRQGRDHPYRGRPGSSDQSRHAVPEGRRAARLRACARRGCKYPHDRASPARDKFKRVSWDVALDRIARLMKDDRDKNFIAKNDDGVTVNRWITTGFLAASATTNETAWVTYKVVRSAGMLVFDNQARV